MEEEKKDICRLCLKCEGNTFTPLDVSSKENSKMIVPELNLDASADFVICSKCKDSLEESCALKKVCSETDQFIRTQIEKENITDKVNLNSIVNKSSEANSESPNTEDVCRVCLKDKELNHMTISTAKEDDTFTTALKTCLPELDVELTANPVICEGCHKSLRDMYAFRTECLSSESKVKGYCEATSESEIDLTKILNYLKNDSKKSLGEDNFLSEFEVQDEEEADIFDIFPNFEGQAPTTAEKNETNKKRPLTDDPSEESAKKPKTEVAEDELPHFNFNFNLIFNPQTEGTMEEWLAQVDVLKTKFGWSDYVTIHKVLVKLKGMDELYTWFSNISEIMTWDEWKKKLLQMFPQQNDYYIKLKRMLNRKKKHVETYLEYYESKLKLIQELSVPDDKVVSCLIGGITDIAVGCIARVGNYKTSEELLEYFKSCNDKKPSVITSMQNDKPKAKGAAPDKNSPHTNAEKKADKKKRIKCFTCHKFGHRTRECWENLQTTPNGTAKAKLLTPGAIKSPQRPRLRPNKRRCIHCGKLGHANQACPTKRPESGPPAAKSQAPNANTSPRSRVVGGPEKKSARPQQNQKKQKVNPPSSRCHNCLKFGHLTRNCRRPNAGALAGYPNRSGSGARLQQLDNERYFGRDMMLDRLQEDSSRIVCFKCFRVGHDARDCLDYSGRAFRN